MSQERNSLANTATTAGQAGSKWLLKRAALTAIGALSPFWVPVVIFVLVFFFVFIAVLNPFLPGGDQDQSVSAPIITPAPTSTPSTSLSPTPSGPTPVEAGTPACDRINQELSSRFNITVTGTAGCSERQKLFSVVSLPSRSSSYYSFLKGLKLTAQFVPRSRCEGGYAPSASKFVVYGNCGDFLKYLFIHEIGHNLRREYDSLDSSFPWSTLIRSDASCYDRGFLKSYGYRGEDGVSPKSESFAEAAALYVLNEFYANGTKSKKIANFKQECPNTYNVMKANLFGGYEFN